MLYATGNVVFRGYLRTSICAHPAAAGTGGEGLVAGNTLVFGSSS